MSVVISDCVGCTSLKRIKTDRITGKTELFCLAFPNGIPQKILVANKSEGEVCADNVGFSFFKEEKASTKRPSE